MKNRAAELGAREVEALRHEFAQRVADIAPARRNANPEDVQRSVAKLVLTLMELLRKLFENRLSAA